MKKILLLSCILFCLISVGYSQSTTVYTCKGGAVSADISSAGTPAQKAAWRQEFLNWGASRGLGESDILDEASGAYNCHAYAWHLREGNTNQVWINNAIYSASGCQPETHNIDTYWNDGCYIKVCNSADADKIHYYCGDHSAVTSLVVTGKYESKWGRWPVIRHDPTTVPYEQPTTVNYYASTKISGDNSTLCTGTRTFLVKNISGATYTWTYSSSLIANGPRNLNYLDVQRNGSSNGAAWVEVQISTPCSGSSAISRIDFSVGTQTPTNIVGLNPPLGVSPGELLELEADNLGMQSYNWWVEGGTIRGSSNSSGVTIEVDRCYGQYNGWLNVHLSYQNACGTSDAYGEYTTIDCGTGGGPLFAMSPNPTSDNVTIDGRETNKSIKEVQVIDKLGTVKKIVKYSGDQKLINFSISSLPADIYYIKIFDGQKWESKQLRKQ